MLRGQPGLSRPANTWSAGATEGEARPFLDAAFGDARRSAFEPFFFVGRRINSEKIVPHSPGSPMPAAAGARRYENRGRWFGGRVLVSLPQPTTSPRFPPRIGVRGMLSIAGMTRWVAGMTGLAGATETYERDGEHSSRTGVRDMLSYQSPMPAGAGTPRYENETWSLEVFGCHGCHPSPLDSGLRRNDEFGGGNHSSRIGVRDIWFRTQ